MHHCTAASHVFLMLAALALASCYPCIGTGQRVLPESIDHHGASIGLMSEEKRITLDERDAFELIVLLEDCRECVVKSPPDVMETPNIAYDVRFPNRAGKDVCAPTVLLQSSRELLHARCRNAVTQRKIREILDRYMDELDAHAKVGRTRRELKF